MNQSVLNVFKLLILFVLAFSSINAKAQDSLAVNEFQNRIGIAVGLNHGYVKDLNFSALNYRESGLLYSLDYISMQAKGKSVFTVDVDLSLGKLNTHVSDFFMSYNTVVNLEVSYLKNINLKNKKWDVYLGVQYNSFLQIMDWNDYESFSYLATHGLGIKGLAHYTLNVKHSFQTSLFAPIIQQLVRPPYNGIDENVIENQDNTLKLIVSGEIASYAKYFAFDWKFNYTYNQSKKLDINISYLLRYQNVNETNRFTQLQNQITTGLSLKF